MSQSVENYNKGIIQNAVTKKEIGLKSDTKVKTKAKKGKLTSEIQAGEAREQVDMSGKNCLAAANTKELSSCTAPGVGHFL